MNRRAALTVVTTATASALAGCGGVDIGTSGAGDEEDDHKETDANNNGASQESDAPTHDPPCDSPAYIFDQDNQRISFDFAMWMIWGDINTTSSSMNRERGNVSDIEWNVGDKIARDNSVYEIQVADGALVMEPTNGGQR
ncbi:uncharacterized protein NP_6072A (plasmid) [Natronomonas pharaonis DSM 2160]|uniref:Uncharacterized protein n=1 Tax=Natronomonas pharaonis (strain ATCC 35678 / DSM 2160 / CIP 103997 / JCM 8858 / NBRC 14720 / NCIMB 2260 / Gabara) TaxID=348780 RepID=Q3IM47_NATPD|nr:hypothetical protein [Natronomonas pharaonis]CAI50816.1 uncharacterized protein NP_6072A [Natronomonas pharaonis DSM 2160]